MEFFYLMDGIVVDVVRASNIAKAIDDFIMPMSIYGYASVIDDTFIFITFDSLWSWVQFLGCQKCIPSDVYS